MPSYIVSVTLAGQEKTDFVVSGAKSTSAAEGDALPSIATITTRKPSNIEPPLAIMFAAAVVVVVVVAVVCVTVIASYIDRGAQQSATPKIHLASALSADSVSPPMSSFGALDDINKQIKEAEITHPLNPFPSYEADEAEDIFSPSNAIWRMRNQGSKNVCHGRLSNFDSSCARSQFQGLSYGNQAK